MEGVDIELAISCAVGWLYDWHYCYHFKRYHAI